MTPEMIRESRAEYLAKPLPSSAESERVILGAILLDNQLISQAIEQLHTDDFYSPLHRRIFKAMTVLFERGERIDPILIGEELKKDGSIESIGGVAAITNLTYGLPHFSDIFDYAKVVKDKSIVRNLIKVCNQITSEALAEEYTAKEVLDFAEKEIFALRDSLETEKAAINGIFETALIVNNTIIDNKKHNKTFGLKTGLRDLDDKTSGQNHTDLIITGARSSMGKSSLMLRKINGIVEHQPEAVCVIFSGEMSKDLCVTRLVCQKAKVNLSRYKQGLLISDDWRKIQEAIAFFEDKRIEIIDETRITPMRMRYYLNRIRDKYKRLDYACADYVEIMDDDSQHEHERLRVGAIALGCKNIAKDYGIPFNLLSQLSRKCESRNPPKPILSDLAESGKLEAHADVVELIYREEYYKKTDENQGLAEILFAKNRNGATGGVKCAWLAESMDFEDYYGGY